MKTMKTIEELQKHLDDAKMRIAEIENGLNMMKAEPEKNRYPMELLQVGSPNAFQRFEFGGRLRKYILFGQIVETCREWNRIDGFEPDWGDSSTVKYCVCNFSQGVKVSALITNMRPLCFNSKETTQLFLDTFKDEIEQVKDLI